MEVHQFLVMLPSREQIYFAGEHATYNCPDVRFLVEIVGHVPVRQCLAETPVCADDQLVHLGSVL